MPRTVQTIHLAWDGQINSGFGIPTVPTGRHGKVSGLSKLILVDFAWVAKLQTGPQTYEGVTTRYEFNTGGDEHLLVIEADNGTFTYVLMPAQFKAADGGHMCFLGQIISPAGVVLPGSEAVPYRPH